jgi:hypothetical protein
MRFHGGGTKVHPGPARPEPVYYRNIVENPLSLALLGGNELQSEPDAFGGVSGPIANPNNPIFRLLSRVSFLIGAFLLNAMGRKRIPDGTARPSGSGPPHRHTGLRNRSVADRIQKRDLISATTFAQIPNPGSVARHAKREIFDFLPPPTPPVGAL